MSDHAAPGACLTHPDAAARHALATFACIGNKAVVRTGPAAGTVGLVRLSSREVDARRRAHEERFAALLADFERLDLQPVVLSSADPDEVLGAFLDWAAVREQMPVLA